MTTLYFAFDARSGRSEPVPQSRAKSVVKVPFVVPPNLKVSCQRMDVCKSSSKRKAGWVCGSNYSHSDRVGRCVEYCRLCRGVVHGERGGRPI